MSFTFSKDKKDKSNEIAFEILFDDYYDRVYKSAFSILLDEELAKEATQEAFAKAFNKIDTLRDSSKFGSWVCTIAVNVCKDMLKRIIVDRQNNVSIYDHDGRIKDYINELRDFNIPENIYENIEIREELKYCIDELDTDTQMIINLKYYHDFTYKEIAEILNIKEGTVKTRLYRAKKKIAKSLERHFNVTGVENSV